MFAVIYQLFIHPGREEEYQKAWNQIAAFFVEHRGAIGSTLHKCEDGSWVAYSRWPNRALRDAAWPGENAPSDVLPEAIRQAIGIMKECADGKRKMPELCLEVVDTI
jgi:hypothetical protein